MIPLSAIRLVCFGFCIIWAAISLPKELHADEPIQVAASILPQKYFIQKIGGDRVRVAVMVLPGASPATYEPKPRQMVDLSKARIYFAIGVPFEENWLSKFKEANPQMSVSKTHAGIAKTAMNGGGHGHHGDRHASEKSAGGTKDPHIWLSPPLVKVQAKNILDSLVKADPANRDFYETNYRAFLAELTALDGEIRKILAPIDRPKRRFMVYHPSWGYFARAYGLKQIPIETEGKNPSPKMLLHLIQEARKEGIRIIFVQPQFSKKSADTIAHAIGGEVMFADPLAEDWGKNLSQMAMKLGQVLR